MRKRPEAGKKGQRFRGQPIAGGIAIGEVYCLKSMDLEAAGRRSFHVDDLVLELTRYDDAVAASKGQLMALSAQNEDRSLDDVADIFRAQMLILEDGETIDKVRATTAQEAVNVEYVIAREIKELERRFSEMDHAIARAAIVDVIDVYHRLLRNLFGIEHLRSNPIKRLIVPVIVVAKRLIPSDVPLLDHEKVLAIIIEEGSPSSHVCIISRSLGIPALVNVPGLTSIVKNGDIVIADGHEGIVVLHPEEEDLQAYAQKGKDRAGRSASSEAEGMCKTRDGIAVGIDANVCGLGEAQRAFACGAEGIGLLRTEVYYMSLPKMPSMEEETAFYEGLQKGHPKARITVRLLDLGADKTLPYLAMRPEENPQMGCRGIRYLLKHPRLLERQLESVLRANGSGNLRVLLPFVSRLEDLEEARALIEGVCRHQGIGPEGIQVGIMVEVPSVALSMESFLDHADFFSVGTNDLMQYTFAVGRENSELASYREAWHPVMLRMVKSIVSVAKTRDKEVSVCGEMASDPLCACLLVGLGVRSLSTPWEAFDAVRAELAGRDCATLERIAEQALALEKASEVLELLKRG